MPNTAALQNLDLSYNQLTGDVPEGWQLPKNLTVSFRAGFLHDPCCLRGLWLCWCVTHRKKVRRNISGRSALSFTALATSVYLTDGAQLLKPEYHPSLMAVQIFYILFGSRLLPLACHPLPLQTLSLWHNKLNGTISPSWLLPDGLQVYGVWLNCCQHSAFERNKINQYSPFAPGTFGDEAVHKLLQRGIPFLAGATEV